MITISNLLFVLLFLPAIAKESGQFSLPLTKQEGAVPKIILVQSTVQFDQHESAQKPLHMGPKPYYHLIDTKEIFQSRGNPIEV